MKKILIINGPNLNLVGVREPSIYGERSMESFIQELIDKKAGKAEVLYFQSNHEGEIIDKLHEVGFGGVDGVVLNAGAYTHTSLAIADAIRSVKTPVVEVHISNIASREDVRHHSFLSPACVGCIFGFGLKSYELAVDALLNM